MFFYAYADGKKRYNYDNKNPNSWNTAFISFRAGLIGTTITSPLWVVKTRIILYRSSPSAKQGFILPQVFRDMLINEGPKSFFRGYIPSLFLSVYGMI